MDIFFQDPSEIPLPPEEVRIREVRAEPWPDGQRVRVYLEVDPFQQRPNADVKITDAAGEEEAQASIKQQAAGRRAQPVGDAVLRQTRRAGGGGAAPDRNRGGPG